MKTLLAVDESEGAKKAITFLQEMARQMKELEVTVVHVIRPVDYRYITVETASPRWQELLDELEASARQRARELLSTIQQAMGGTPTTILVTVGDPAAEIVNVAKETNADLIVIGSRGLGRVQGVLLGSVSDRVVHMAHCPVLVVR